MANPVFAIPRKTELLGYVCSSTAAVWSEVEKQVACRLLGITLDDVLIEPVGIALSTEYIRREPDFTVGDRKFWVYRKAGELPF